MAMNFNGISSGLPTDQMVKAMLTNEYNALDRLQAKQTTNNQKKTVLNNIKTALTSLATSISSLTSGKLNGRTVAVSDTNAVSASALSTGTASGSYQLVINELASKARLEIGHVFGKDEADFSPTKSGAFSTNDTFTITGAKDGQEATFTVGDKTSLVDVRDMINAKTSEMGVEATIVQTKPGEYKMVLTATETGSGTVGIKNATFSNTDIRDDGVRSVAGENAKFSVNGIDIERRTNTIDDAIEGLSFTLSKADKDKTINLNVQMDTQAVANAFQDVIAKYNAVYNAYKSATGKNGALAGDMSLQGMFGQLRNAISSSVSVLGEGGANWNESAASLGMSTNKDGTLSLDVSKLQEALKNDPEKVGKIFDAMSSKTKTLIDGLTTYGGGTITRLIDSIDTTNSNLSKQIDTMQGRLDRRKENLMAQMAKMETLIGQMQAAGQSLGGLY